MARTGRSFPSHVIISRPTQSKQFVTLSVVSPSSVSVNKSPGKLMTTISNATNLVLPLKLKSSTVLSIVSASSVSLATAKGKGMILSITSPATVVLSRLPTKVLSVRSNSTTSTTKSITKRIGSISTLAPSFLVKSRAIMANFDGGIVSPVSVTVLNSPGKPGVIPGLFRSVAAKAILKVQFKPFIVSIIKRVIIP